MYLIWIYVVFLLFLLRINKSKPKKLNVTYLYYVLQYNAICIHAIYSCELCCKT